MYLEGEDNVRAALHEADKLIEAQRIEIDALRKDAERYRWLRAQYWGGPLCAVANPRDAVKLGHDCPSLDRLDQMIDAAMAGQG